MGQVGNYVLYQGGPVRILTTPEHGEWTLESVWEGVTHRAFPFELVRHPEAQTMFQNQRNMFAQARANAAPPVAPAPSISRRAARRRRTQRRRRTYNRRN